MMQTTAFGSRSTCTAQAWPGQATGAALANGSSRTRSQATISFPQHQYRSLQAPRSHKAFHALINFGHIGSSPEIQPAINTHRSPLGNGLVQPIFSPPSRRSPLLCSPSLSRRDAGLKMLCLLLSEPRHAILNREEQRARKNWRGCTSLKSAVSLMPAS
jgi:hypothetical protein